MMKWLSRKTEKELEEIFMLCHKLLVKRHIVKIKVRDN